MNENNEEKEEEEKNRRQQIHSHIKLIRTHVRTPFSFFDPIIMNEIYASFAFHSVCLMFSVHLIHNKYFDLDKVMQDVQFDQFKINENQITSAQNVID